MSQQSSKDKAFVTSFEIIPEIKEPVDTSPSEYQPPGVDEEREPQSLEEALLGE